MNSKPDKEWEERGDIFLLSEIITDSIYWQEIVRWHSVKFEANLEHIINFAGLRIISIYQYFRDVWFSGMLTQIY
jgi:hypothetical protein